MELELAGQRYRSSKLNAIEQFNVVRRIAPVLSGLGESFDIIPTPNGQDEANPQQTEANVWSALAPVADALSNMPDDHVSYVLKLCLGKCQRLDEHTQTWARITTPSGEIIYQDIDVSVMMQLVVSIIQENLGSFFSAPLPQTSGEGLGSRLN